MGYRAITIKRLSSPQSGRCRVRLSTLTLSFIFALTGCGGGGGGNEPTPPTPPPTSATYTIQVSTAPVEAVTSLGTDARGTVSWQFSASPSTSSSVAYTVTSQTSGVTVTNGSGSVSPGTAISTQLRFSCSQGGTVTATLVLQVGSTRENVTWDVTCTEEQIEADELLPARAAASQAVTNTLVWRFQTSGPADRSINYSVSVSSNVVDIANATGSTTAGSDIRNPLGFTCDAPNAHDFTLTLSAGSATQQVPWQITCTDMPLEKVSAKFYQGSLIAEVEFNNSDQGWKPTLVPYNYFQNRGMSLAFNRQVFITLQSEHEEESKLELGLTFEDIDADSSVEFVSRSTKPRISGGVRVGYTNRNVFAVTTSDLRTLGPMTILIDPDDKLPQVDETKNEIDFDLTTVGISELPLFKLVIVPIIGPQGSPDLSNRNVYVDTVYELLPIGPMNVRTRAAFDARDTDFAFEGDNTPLEALYDLWLTEADRDEYYHGIFKADEGTRLCGIAYISLKIGVTAELSEICSSNTIAHEIGHNLSLGHAPACGAEVDADPDYPRSDGTIGAEGGWLMRKRQPVGTESITSSAIYDTMAYCLETFTSRYSYGKAHDFRAIDVKPPVVSVASTKPIRDATSTFEIVEGKSLVLSGSVMPSGEWSLRTAKVVNKPPHQRTNEPAKHFLELLHTQSGQVLYRESLSIYDVAHSPSHARSWGTRIPAFDVPDIEFRIVENEGNIVLHGEL